MAINGREIVRLESAGSTNDAALEYGGRGAAEGRGITTEEQTAGRGHLGRRWLAPPHGVAPGDGWSVNHKQVQRLIAWHTSPARWT
ncbi:MAG: hypothetical protein ACM3JD_04520 [Rudaea sp.]